MTPPTAAAAATIAETLVVGAGWSGLIAALRLAEAGRKVVVLEARAGRIGGRAFTHTWTPETGESNARTTDKGESGQQWAVDFGCSWLHGYNEGNPVKALAEKYGVPVHIPKPTASRIVGPNGPLPSALADKLGANLAAAQAAAAEHAGSQDASPDASIASFLFAPSSPLFAGLTTNAEKAHAEGLARLLHVPYGTSLDNVALRWSGFESNIAGTDAAPEGGFTRIISHLVDELTSKGAEIRRGEVVTSIAQGKAPGAPIRITVRANEGKGEERVYEAKSALVTIPLAVLKKTASGLFEPALPPRRLATIDRTNTGNLNKILVAYDEPWWPAEVGTFTVLPTSKEAVDDSTSLPDIFARSTLIVTSNCAPNGLPGGGPNLLAMVGGDGGKAIEKHDRITVAKALHDYLVPRIKEEGKAVPERPNHSFYSRWAKQPFTGGATTTPVVIGEGRSPLDFAELGKPLWNGTLGFAGEHTDVDNHGSVSGAYISGEREAARINRLLAKL